MPMERKKRAKINKQQQHGHGGGCARCGGGCGGERRVYSHRYGVVEPNRRRRRRRIVPVLHRLRYCVQSLQQRTTHTNAHNKRTHKFKKLCAAGNGDNDIDHEDDHEEYYYYIRFTRKYIYIPQANDKNRINFINIYIYICKYK